MRKLLFALLVLFSVMLLAGCDVKSNRKTLTLGNSSYDSEYITIEKYGKYFNFIIENQENPNDYHEDIKTSEIEYIQLYESGYLLIVLKEDSTIYTDHPYGFWIQPQAFWWSD